jgi:hypothetical protein
MEIAAHKDGRYSRDFMWKGTGMYTGCLNHACHLTPKALFLKRLLENVKLVLATTLVA